MNKAHLELYRLFTQHLWLCHGDWSIIDGNGQVSQDQITHFLSGREYRLKVCD